MVIDGFVEGTTLSCPLENSRVSAATVGFSSGMVSSETPGYVNPLKHEEYQIPKA